MATSASSERTKIGWMWPSVLAWLVHGKSCYCWVRRATMFTRSLYASRIAPAFSPAEIGNCMNRLAAGMSRRKLDLDRTFRLER